VSAALTPSTARIAALYVYPVKSARGIALQDAALTRAGLSQDRRWMLVGQSGRCLTQRELPRLALLLARQGERCSVSVWGHECEAFDEGPAVADWLRQLLDHDCRLVRFDPAHRRLSAREWTGSFEAENQFSDKFPILAVSTASLADLNTRLAEPLPMNRFRPNIVLEGLNAFDEDHIDELSDGAIRLKPVKACTRCKITTTNQDTGSVEGDEPLRTLNTYRYDAALHGVCFGQNLIVVSGAGARLQRGQTLQLHWKQ
jgi:uncharacterized protein